MEEEHKEKTLEKPWENTIEDLVDLTSPTPKPGSYIANFMGWNQGGAPLIEIPGFTQSMVAQICTSALMDASTRQVLITIPENSRHEPVITGVIQSEPEKTSLCLKVDGKTIVLTAEEQIEITCGESSIKLSKDGKIRIRGKDILTRSSGGHKIKGAYVNIN